MKTRKVLKWLNHILSGILFAAFLLMIFVVISTKASGGQPQLFGYQLKTVLSGSMEPGIKTGSLIAVKPGGDMTRFKKGDVITFKRDEKTLVTHRIIKVDRIGGQVRYHTKGDNNKTPDLDPVLSQNVVAKYTGFTLPYAGYFISFTQSKSGSAILLVLPGLLLMCYSALMIWKAISQIDSKKEASLEGEEKPA